MAAVERRREGETGLTYEVQVQQEPVVEDATTPVVEEAVQHDDEVQDAAPVGEDEVDGEVEVEVEVAEDDYYFAEDEANGEVEVEVLGEVEVEVDENEVNEDDSNSHDGDYEPGSDHSSDGTWEVFEETDEASSDAPEEENDDAEILRNIERDFDVAARRANQVVNEGEDDNLSNELKEIVDSDNEEAQWPEFNEDTDMEHPTFVKGLVFSTKKTLTKAIKHYARVERVVTKLKKNDSRRVHAICKAEGCPWRLWATPMNPADKADDSWQIRNIKGEHNCVKVLKNRHCTAEWVGETYMEKFLIDANYSLKSLAADIAKDWGTQLTPVMCYRAKQKAMELVFGNQEAQYKKLYEYLKALRDSNPGTTTILHLEERMFQRMYVCMQASKDGWNAGCRKIICLDACHLKGYYKGFLISAVGIDANDHIYPIAYAAVESETYEVWHWFLDLLANDLNINNSHNITFMSDKQKGLVDSILELFPHAESRFCARHLYTNFKNLGGFKGKALKDQFWKAARATTTRDFDVAMADLKRMNLEAFEWLKAKDARQWSRAHFLTRSKSDILLNNNSECYNKMLNNVRHLPILTMFEGIRNGNMKRNVRRLKATEKFVGTLCAKARDKLDQSLNQAISYIPTYAGGNSYEVSCGPTARLVVDMHAKTCTCRKWQLTGIPCSHVASICRYNNDDAVKYVDPCYLKSTQLAIYSHLIAPVQGPEQWEPVPDMESIFPPPLRRPPGRPSKGARRREPGEPSATGNISREGLRGHCKRCNKVGHNVRTCKGPVGGNVAGRASTTNNVRGRGRGNGNVRGRGRGTGTSNVKGRGAGIKKNAASTSTSASVSIGANGANMNAQATRASQPAKKKQPLPPPTRVQWFGPSSQASSSVSNPPATQESQVQKKTKT